MLKFICHFFCYALLILTLFGLPAIVSAQDRVTVNQAIRFRPGAISARIAGRVVKGASHHYRVRARANQQMAVVLTTGDKTSFTVSVRNWGIIEGADGVRRCLIDLPESGEYLIEIGTDATAANYSLEITIH